MSELRIFLRRDVPVADCAWVLRDANGAVSASGGGLNDLPAARRRHLVLAGDLVVTLPAALPDLSQRRLAPLLAAAAEADTLDEAEKLHVAWLGRDAAGLSWLAVLDRAWLTQTLAALREKSVEVDAALPETLLLPLAPDTWSVLWQEDGAVVRYAELRGLALDRNQPPAGLRMALALALAQPGPARIQVYRGNALHPADLPAWRAALEIPCEDAGPWSWREAAWPRALNLLQGELQPHHSRIDWPAQARRLAWGLALLAGIQFTGMSLDWLLLARERQTLQAGMRELAERALPAHAAIVDPAWQVSERLRALRAARGEGGGGFMALLNRVGQVWPVDTKVNAIDYRDDRLTLTLDTPPGAWLDGFQSALAGKGLRAIRGSEGNSLVIRAGQAETEENQHGR
ncbi:MAG: type II secretion system protein GspL [Pseudomonadota bacterium]|nr:type II secretion system protein GspL [Pseudomonadota bacterium]